MAKKVAVAENVSSPRRRLTAEEKEGIGKALDAGETGAAIAERFQTSVATVYAVRKKSAPAKASGQTSENPLRHEILGWAVRTLLQQPVTEQETADLKAKLEAEMVRRVLSGI